MLTKSGVNGPIAEFTAIVFPEYPGQEEEATSIAVSEDIILQSIIDERGLRVRVKLAHVSCYRGFVTIKGRGFMFLI